MSMTRGTIGDTNYRQTSRKSPDILPRHPPP